MNIYLLTISSSSIMEDEDGGPELGYWADACVVAAESAEQAREEAANINLNKEAWLKAMTMKIGESNIFEQHVMIIGETVKESLRYGERD